MVYKIAAAVTVMSGAALASSLVSTVFPSSNTGASSETIAVASVPSGTASANTSSLSVATAGTAYTATAAPAPGGFVLGVQTHFSQGWNPSWLALGNQISARSIRDTVTWSSAEQKPGVYDFSSKAVSTLTAFCAQGGTINLTIVPKNPLYDNGIAVYSETGRTAYAAYLNALLKHFGQCVSAVEIGNEINNAAALNYPAGYDKPTTYVALLKAIYAKVKPGQPNVTILAGSTSAIGTGFLEPLFAAGALNVVDGIAVHPYRSEPEGIDVEIARLNAVMARYGAPKPIWATEYGFIYTDQRRASSALVKSVVQLYAAGVTHASWYALVDQKGFPNMGLFSGLTMKPQGRAFRAVQDWILPFGQPVRQNTGDMPINVYKIGSNRWVIWGGKANLVFSGSPVVRDMFGNVVGSGPTVTVGEDPLIVTDSPGFSIASNTVVADTLTQWGLTPWTYFRRDMAGRDTQLGWFDNDFTSHFGDRWSKPLRINNISAAPVGTRQSAIRAVVRYTAPASQKLILAACFTKTVAGDGVDYRVEKNGVRISEGILTSEAILNGIPIDVAAGDRIDLVFGPNQTAGGDSFSYRATLSRPDQPTSLVCPGV